MTDEFIVENFVLQKEIENRLSQYIDVHLEKNLAEARAIKSVKVDEDKITIDIGLSYPHQSIKQAMISQLTDYIRPLSQDKSIFLHFHTQIEPHGKRGLPNLPQVKNIIAVASGKGGVGKSTVATNLALALRREGAEVGLLDADIYGPSQPYLLGSMGERPVIKDRHIQPIIRHDIQTISIGNLVDANAAMAWRGPMLGKALQQLMQDTEWQALDYLIVDLPPGTGDVQLTLCQKIPVSGAVIVTTPQDLALLDVRRACEMFVKLDVPLLGVIENMSVYQCTHCGHQEKIFGEGGGNKLVDEYKLKLLGQIPLDLRIRKMAETGAAFELQDNSLAELWCSIARKTSARLAGQKKDYSTLFPKIVVERGEK